MQNVRLRAVLVAALAAAALVAPSVASATTIQEVQGAAHISPLAGTVVTDVEGVVTARRTAGGRGIWIQDADGDGDVGTSDAVFVFTGASPTAQVGELVRVRGTVTEFRSGGIATPQLTITQISANNNANVTRLGPGAAAPETVLGLGGRVPPTEVIEDDADGSVETSGVFDPAQDAIDFYESLEGMLLRVNGGGAVVAPTRSFGEIVLLPDGGSWATFLATPRGGIFLNGYVDANPERITVDDEILRDLAPTPRPAKSMPDMDVGAVVTSPVVGPLDYSFSNFKIQATTMPTFVPSTIEREVAEAPTDHQLAVATFNVENLSAVNPQSKFDELAGMVVANLRSPDLIAIEEVQDDNGAPPSFPPPMPDGVVDASQTWAKLIAAIQGAGGPLYEYRQIDPVDFEEGGAPGGNIRVGFLFRTDRGLSLIHRPGGTPTAETTVLAHPSGPRLSFSPGRIGTDSVAFDETRRSLAGEFRFRGKKLFVIANHFSSKTDDQPLFGHVQPPARLSEGPRHGQAQLVNDFVDDILAVDSNANVIVLGDINDFEFSETVDILEGGVVTTLVDTLAVNERYSYNFEGNSQVLDQILATDGLLDRLVEYDVVHVNAEFAQQASDHEPSVARFHMIGRP